MQPTPVSTLIANSIHQYGHRNIPVSNIPHDPQKHVSSAAPVRVRAASKEILTGKAGSNLVLSRLQSWGIVAHLAMSGVAYDLIADVPGVDLVRIQVKTQSRAVGERCSFDFYKEFYRSKSKMFRYSFHDFDIAALVCLSVGQIHFYAAPIHQISFRADWQRMPETDGDTFQAALHTFEKRRRTECLAWLASMEPDIFPESSEEFSL